MSKSNPVIAIGLDAADPNLIEPWMESGDLPNLRAISEQGAYRRLQNQVNYQGASGVEFSSTEPLWTQFLTGCLPDKTGFWDTVTYEPEDYSVRCDPIYGGYDYDEYSPFYSLAQNKRVLAFDVPVSRVVPGVDGIQITGWGGHHPFVPSESNPPTALENILAKYGENPVFRKDNGYWWNDKYMNWVSNSVQQSVETRVKIFDDLMAQGPWDLFLTAFGETHTLGHDLLHTSEPKHPLFPFHNKMGTVGNPMLNGFKQVDAAVGELIAKAPEDAYVAIFALHGMDVNHTDLLSMMFIGEIMYRFNFPGKCGLTPGNINESPGPVIHRNIRNGWPGEVWRQMHEPNMFKRVWNTWAPKRYLDAGTSNGLLSPYTLEQQGEELAWMPAMAYSPLWPKMKAFAIPGFADAHIRINLAGRERDGIVKPEEYDALCAEITDMLFKLRDGRTKKPLVKDVVRTRTLNPLEANDEKLPESDLVVVWHDIYTDVVDSPDFGRIGPITYNRSGGHRDRGFLMLKGPGIDSESIIQNGRSVDVGATILDLMGVEIPEYFDGHSLLNRAAVAGAIV